MWVSSKARHLRTPKSIARALNAMEKKFGTHITVDHGVANYRYDHYELEEATYKNHWNETITVFVEDFWTHNIIPYMTVNEDSLRKPTKDDREWGVELISCCIDPEFPSILNMFEYDA